MEYRNELYHHGIRGQKWGKKNGPPYPLKESAHSAAEKKANWKKSLNTEDKNSAEKSVKFSSMEEAGKKATNKVIHESGKRTLSAKHDVVAKSTNNIQKTLGLSDQNYMKAKKIAKIAGISVATGAGLFLLGCAMDGLGGPELLNKPIEDLTDTDLSHALDAINHDKDNISKAFDLDDGLFANPYNGDYVGVKARADGYGEIDSDFLKEAIANPIKASDEFYQQLYDNVRHKYVDDSNDRTVDRRLSCWSASTAYYLSALTGRPFISKNFQNAVDFDKLGKMFSEDPEIYDLFGKKVRSFVGPYGENGTKATSDLARTLTESIFKNIDQSNNLSPDGSRTVGFINAGYHGGNLPHEWSFEILYDNGTKILTMIDGFGGDKSVVARQLSNGKIERGEFMYLFENEIKAYNKESIRFYAPRLETVNPEIMAKVVLGKA